MCCRVPPVAGPHGEVRVSAAGPARQVPVYRRPRAVRRLLRLPRQGGRKPRPLLVLQDGEWSSVNNLLRHYIKRISMYIIVKIGEL